MLKIFDKYVSRYMSREHTGLPRGTVTFTSLVNPEVAQRYRARVREISDNLSQIDNPHDLATTLENDFGLSRIQALDFMHANACEFYEHATPEEREAYMAEVNYRIVEAGESLMETLASFKGYGKAVSVQSARNNLRVISGGKS